MKVDSPLVSVIIPAYNAEAFINQTLISVLSQTYKNIEVLVVDDGSLDKTAEIIESFADKDSRVIILKQPNAGVAAARNLAIEKSKGEYIAPIDADDIWYPQKIEKQVQCMLEGDPTVGLIYAWSTFIDAKDNIIGEYCPFHYQNMRSVEGYVYPVMVQMNLIGNGSVPLIRRSCFDKIGFYDSKLREQNAQGCEDWDIYLRIAEFYEFRVVPEFLIGYRQLVGSMSRCYEAMAKSYDLVMAKSKRQNLNIPAYMYDWSASDFCSYLLTISTQNEDYWNSFLWLNKAIKLDLFRLLQIWVYKCYFKCIIKILSTKIKYLMLSKDESLGKHKEKNNHYHENIGVGQMRTPTDIHKEMLKPKEISQKPYDKIRRQRWLHVLKVCRSLSYNEVREGY
ncbi:MAG: glycosyltransferase family 2 protein [Calothrix sp. FI2-JRJ7]|jgi:glycosyltransferase involved in cell wall biosynthesis|nr:glycosyltransferase family 2 protein [Calothrix sp. FI2-JRJ7]